MKTEGYEVLKNAHKWLGKEVVDPMIDKLPDAMKKELEKFWESYDKTTVMTAPKDVPD